MSKDTTSLLENIDSFPTTSHLSHYIPAREVVLAKKILFSCTICTGALVPISTCMVCKRTAKRQCVSCQAIKNFGDHNSCQDLISLRSEIVSRIEIKKEVNQ